MTTDAYPLRWPAGRPRTPAARRKDGAFSKRITRGEPGYSYTVKGALSVADALLNAAVAQAREALRR